MKCEYCNGDVGISIEAGAINYVSVCQGCQHKIPPQPVPYDEDAYVEDMQEQLKQAWHLIDLMVKIFRAEALIEITLDGVSLTGWLETNKEYK